MAAGASVHVTAHLACGERACASQACVFAVHPDDAAFRGFCCHLCRAASEQGSPLPEHGPLCRRRRPQRARPHAADVQHPAMAAASLVDAGSKWYEPGGTAGDDLDGVLALASGDTGRYRVEVAARATLDAAHVAASSSPRTGTNCVVACQAAPSNPQSAADAVSAVARPTQEGSPPGEQAKPTSPDAWEVSASERRLDPATWHWLSFPELVQRDGGFYGMRSLQRYWESRCMEERRYGVCGTPITWREFRSVADASLQPQQPWELRRNWRHLHSLEDGGYAAIAASFAGGDDDGWEEGAENNDADQHDGDACDAHTSLLQLEVQALAGRGEVEAGRSAMLAVLEADPESEPRHAARYTDRTSPPTRAAVDARRWMAAWDAAALSAGFV